MSATLFPDRIETERLVLEPLTPETLDAFELYEFARVGAPHIDEVTEYVTWDPYETPQETVEFYESVAADRQDGEGETYAVFSRNGEDDPGEFAGLAGIGVDWDRQLAEFGTWLRKRFWGRGYSGERAAALMEVAFERLDLETVAVTVQRGNEKSRTAVSRYIEAHGGHREGLLRNFQRNADGTVVDVHRYTVTQEEYREATAE